MSTDSFVTPTSVGPVATPANFSAGPHASTSEEGLNASSVGGSGSGFVPWEPASWEEAGLAIHEVGALAMKILLHAGSVTGRRIAEQLKLPFSLVGELLRSLKTQLFITYKGSALVNDYEYELTVAGLERGRRYNEHCTYCGAAPVSLDDYATSVQQQTLRRSRPRKEQVRAAFHDLVLSEELLGQLGQAVHAGRGLFLYGPPGNGKSSIAERAVRAASEFVWIPRTITVNGELIRLFDPASHREAPLAESGELLHESRIDRRWVRIRRPTLVVGGELSLTQLEVSLNPGRGIHEAPLQMKANCGALVVDDFGRQRVSTGDLLNRFIVPLEKGYDFVMLPSGRQIQIPFDELLIFATNLEPSKLFDEAFLRRIPYKFEIPSPTEAEFRALFHALAATHHVTCENATLDHLIASYYRPRHRCFRFCHPRDLLQQVENFCEFHDRPFELSVETLDVAAKNYFAGL